MGGGKSNVQRGEIPCMDTGTTESRVFSQVCIQKRDAVSQMVYGAMTY